MNSENQTAKRRIFVVDDHPLVREWLTTLINQQPDLIVCGESESAPHAFSAIGETKPAAAIVDLSLKDSSGLELIKNLKESYPDVVVLVLSMHEEVHYAERALRAGAKGYVMKQESTQKLVEAVRKVLEGKIYLNGSLAEALTVQYVEGKTHQSESRIDQLSDRELEVFEMLGRGLGTRQIAEAMHISLKTVQAYCARMKEKLNLASGTELLREAIRWSDQRHPR